MEVTRWQPPWPAIQISDREWVIMRDDPRHPAALVRRLDDAPSGAQYRVVRWAPKSEDRRLFEYFPTLEKADQAVTFMDVEPSTGHAPLTSARSPEWGRFERWFWGQASDRLLLEATPAWFYRQAMAQGRAASELQLREARETPQVGRGSGGLQRRVTLALRAPLDQGADRPAR